MLLIQGIIITLISFTHSLIMPLFNGVVSMYISKFSFHFPILLFLRISFVLIFNY